MTSSPNSRIASIIFSWGGPPEWAWRSRSRKYSAPTASLQRWNSATHSSGSPSIKRFRPQIVQGYLVLRPDAAELRQSVPPVILVGGHNLRPVYLHGLGGGSWPPRRPASGTPAALARRVPPPPGRFSPAQRCWSGLVLGPATNPSAMRPARRAPGRVLAPIHRGGACCWKGLGVMCRFFQLVILAGGRRKAPRSSSGG